jgi:arylsulfatase A-like enzyme
MRMLLALLLLLAVAAAPQAQTRPASPTPGEGGPNILLIFADDLGWKDVGYQGSDFYETPNIDRLAQDGMVFAQAYAGAGNCAPSRAVLLSGQYTPRHGVYAVESTDRGPKPLMRMIPIPNRSGLAQSTETMADALKASGYATGIFGKWHLGGPEGAAPGQQGFDVVFDSRAPNPNVQRDEPDDPKGIYSLTREAISFIEKNRERPFFAFVSHHAIHTALEARPSSLAKFKAKKPGEQHRAPLYAACLYDLDDGVGLLLAKLKELGLEQNTLVVFMSDNGGTQQSSQEPLRGSKGGYYEGGIREPLIVRWPGVVKSGSRSDVPVHNVDLYPTFLAVAGAIPRPGHTLDGESLLPLLRGNGALRRTAIFWHFPGYLNAPVIRGRDPVFRTRPVSVIRKGEWKLHLYHEEWQLDGGRAKIATNRSVELYNIASDIGERRDLATSNPRKRDELLDDLLAWLKAVNAPLPTERNPAHVPEKPTSEKRAPQ